ncbi:MAG: substrate-binding domain-containing protein [Planctomycetes bacterium]|nr:substrate-binding domain-containing protein [Planctomycetota bacterium]MCH9723843.1 substrate-binding domain-containing protein [Planctomycetota bacterium]MCH9776252.1 substrate-binding domain-containing protein [Planctomycetota bacterium]MCH9792570.1 substrate-binding domain-containing protein [Planctomycetota bacterium]
MKKLLRIAIVIDLSWPYKRHLEVFDGVNRYAVEAGWECELLPLSDSIMSHRTKWQFDGIIGRLGTEIVKRARRARVPVVNVWYNSTAENIPGVFPDWNIAGKMAAEHLIARGFRRFVYLGFRRDKGTVCQLNGFQSTLQNLGFDCDCHLVGRNYSHTQGQWDRLSRRLLELTQSLRAPVGVCVSDDLLGRFLLDACLRVGHNVPHDVAILSSNNEPLVCENSSPSLSSIELGYRQIGWRAGELLDKLMRRTDVSNEIILHPPQSLVLRQSTDAFAVDNQQVASALRFIANQCHRALTVSDVARHVVISRRTLERRFQDFLGRTIADEITRMRLARTKRQLLENDEAIKTIAYRNGFRDASHLCTVFRREFGMTPGDFRAQQK